jgi:hypothetical protein
MTNSAPASGANDYNTKIIEEFRANQGRVGGRGASAQTHSPCCHRYPQLPAKGESGFTIVVNAARRVLTKAGS